MWVDLGSKIEMGWYGQPKNIYQYLFFSLSIFVLVKMMLLPKTHVLRLPGSSFKS
jgi:hypothetical protein